MKPVKLKNLHYVSPREKKLIDRITVALLYTAIGLLLITALIIKSGVK
ncbi:MAG: hypothetical protein HW421_1156 [Ignavibacteria bacterium]|nr:hypothetical protein [Ignavibacteria bacterium]